MKVITFFNHAGGVAKTSTVRDLGNAFASMGKRILLIDMDPQANLTEWLGVNESIDLASTAYPGIIGNPDALELPKPLRIGNLDLIPSCLSLAIVEREILSVVLGVLRLRESIRALSGYDYVFIDPPPSLGQLSALSVIAADRVVVPLPTNRKGLDGLATVSQMVREYRKAAPGLKIAMFVLTQHDRRTRHAKDSIEAIMEYVQPIAPVSSPLGFRPAVYSDSQVAGLPIKQFMPMSEASAEIDLVASELLTVLEEEANDEKNI